MLDLAAPGTGLSTSRLDELLEALQVAFDLSRDHAEGVANILHHAFRLVHQVQLDQGPVVAERLEPGGEPRHAEIADDEKPRRFPKIEPRVEPEEIEENVAAAPTTSDVELPTETEYAGQASTPLAAAAPVATDAELSAESDSVEDVAFSEPSRATMAVRLSQSAISAVSSTRCSANQASRSSAAFLSRRVCQHSLQSRPASHRAKLARSVARLADRS